tara:strand:+ start:555 stop:788 length:234 start_codon:yes stop_codon:yes gene_type:complete
MTYTIQQKDKRPAGDWLIIAMNEDGKMFHHSFNSEPTDSEVDQLAKKKTADYIAAKAAREAEEAEEAARIAAEEAEE